jgi:penicillin amidase
MRRSATVLSLVLAALALLLGSPPLPAATFEIGAVPPEESLGPAVEVPGILAPVRVRRDVHDVPHIFARNDRDALFALGRAHARDRFFQMDLLRRTFSGTLAELVGDAALDSDVQLRTLGLRRAAVASLPALSNATRAWLNAYARGVNSWLRDPANPLPPEYTALELTRAGIPAWTPVDSLVIAKGLAFGLSFDLGDIDLTMALGAFQSAGEEAAAFDGTALFSQDIYRSAPFDPAVSIPGFLSGSSTARGQGPLSRWRERDRERVDGINPLAFVPQRGLDLVRRYREQAGKVPLLRRAFEHREGARGSNWWVARGNVTASGRPLLANDPHLALDTPAIFYEAQLRVSGGERPAMNAFGVTFPGIPGIVLGCNPRICWGATTNPMDVTDVYLERLVLDPESGLPVATLFDGRPEPLVFVPQAFRVNQVGNGTPNDLADAGIGPLEGGVTLLVPRRNNGPIVGIDISEPSQPLAISVQYTGWGATRELDAFRTWNRAGSIPEFVAGLQFFDVGSQNWAYADVAGNIAYWTSAENPLREDLQNLERADGNTPPWLIRDGTHTLRHEWLRDPSARPGIDFPFRSLPFAEMPQVVNPARGWIANANQDPVGTTLDNDPLDQERRGGQGLFYLSPGYEPGFRMGRIVRLLEGELARDGSFSAEDFKRFQANNQLLDAEVFTPHLLAAFDRASRPRASAALAALAADPRVAEAVGRLRTWDWSTPTGIPQGWDPGDDTNPLPAPSAGEISRSVAATIYSVWRGEVVRRTIDRTLIEVGLGDFVPDGGQALVALRHHLERFPQNGGVGASGLQFFRATGAASPAEARDLTLLGSLQAALDLLASDAFAPAFDNSTNQNDYRWGLLHRVVFDHPLGGPFSIPPRGLVPVAPDLPGVARAGGFGAVDASSHNVRADSVNEFMFDSGPARRFVGELRADGPVAEEVIPGGTSGVLGSPFQTDQLLLWLTNDYHPWPWKPADVAAAARTTEVLDPVTP